MPDNPDEALQRARQRLAAAEAATGGGQFGTPDYSVYEELAAVERWGQGAVDEVHAARRALAAAEAGALNAALGRAPRRGRPSLEEQDALLVEGMREMILAEPGLTPTAAAWRLVDAGKVSGKKGSNPASWVDRLVRRYREKYPA